MIAPTTLAVAATLSAEKRYGSADGHAQLPEDRPLARRVRLHQLDAPRGSADCSPRTVLTVTGKNVR